MSSFGTQGSGLFSTQLTNTGSLFSQLLSQNSLNNNATVSSTTSSNQPQQTNINNSTSNINNHNNNNININAGSGTTWLNNSKKRIIPNHLVPKKRSGFQIVSSSGTIGSGSSTSGSALSVSKRNDKKSLSQSTKSDLFNLLSFGTGSTGRNASASVGSLFDASINGDLTKYDETVNETIHEDFLDAGGMNDDAPPSRSIYDLSNDVLTSLSEPTNLHLDLFLHKDPKSYKNVFNKSGSEADSKDRKDVVSVEDKLKNEELASAILVFGYPETMANQVIQHFQHYGNILEDFETIKHRHQLSKYYQQQIVGGKSTSEPVPLFTGHSWVKLTYSNSNEAINALGENGTVFNGYMLGVIPYHKSSLEKLQKRVLSSGEDIGGDLDRALYTINPSPQAPVDSHATQQQAPSVTAPSSGASAAAIAGASVLAFGSSWLGVGSGAAPPSSSSGASHGAATASSNIGSATGASSPTSASSNHINRIDIKDGSGFFLHSNNVADPSKTAAGKDGKESVLSTVSKYLFGINEL